MRGLKEYGPCKVLLALRRLGRTYANKIVSETGLTYQHVHQRLLPVLEKEGWIIIDRKAEGGPYYQLSGEGSVLATALEDPVAFMEAEERRRLQEPVSPERPEVSPAIDDLAPFGVSVPQPGEKPQKHKKKRRHASIG